MRKMSKMGMSKHTPGPWSYGNASADLPGCVCITSADQWVAEVLVAPDDESKITDEGRANANLIAAAPDHFASSIEAMYWLEHPAVHDAFRGDAELYARLNAAIIMHRAAIAKAKGEKP